MLFHLCDFQKYNFSWLMWFCDMHVPVNTPFLQNASCLFTADAGSAWCTPFTEDSRAMVSFAGLGQELILVQTVTDMMPGTLSHLPALCTWESSQGTVRHVPICGGVRRNLPRKEPSAETGLWRNRGSAHPCELADLRRQKSLHLKSVQLLGRLFWKSEGAKILSKRLGSVQCRHMAISLSHVIFTLCCIGVQPVILYHTVKYDLLHMQ